MRLRPARLRIALWQLMTAILTATATWMLLQLLVISPMDAERAALEDRLADAFERAAVWREEIGENLQADVDSVASLAVEQRAGLSEIINAATNINAYLAKIETDRAAVVADARVTLGLIEQRLENLEKMLGQHMAELGEHMAEPEQAAPK